MPVYFHKHPETSKKEVLKNYMKKIIEWKYDNRKTLRHDGARWKGASFIMTKENRVWEKTAQFLQELRCENISRATTYETREYQTALLEKKEKYKSFAKCMAELKADQQQIIEEYINAVHDCASEECQKTYLQGYIDCVMVLSGAEILKPEKEIENIIELLKKE